MPPSIKRIEIDTTMEIETYLQSFCVSQNIFSTQPWERSSLKFDINLHCNEFTINVGLRIMKNNFQMDLYSFYVKEDSIEIFGLLHWIKVLWVMTEYMVERGNPISEKCSITC